MSRTVIISRLFLLLNASVVLVSGWSDNGWLSGGHAVRMAMEIGLFHCVGLLWMLMLFRYAQGLAGASQADEGQQSHDYYQRKTASHFSSYMVLFIPL